MQKFAFYLIWFLVILIGLYTVLSNTPLSLALKDRAVLLNVIQRLLGLTAFSLIFSQIVIGSFMTRLTQKLGAWIYEWHITEGVFTYLFILAHPFLFVLLNYQFKGTLDPFYVYTDLCLICKTRIEYFYTFGRAAFWLLTLGVGAAYFRTHPWLRTHWLKFHILNFVAFYLIAIHAYFVGSDVRSVPFIYFYWLAVVTVSAILIRKLIKR